MSDFWVRWSRDYLSTLQQRPKHVLEIPNLQVDDMVLLVDERNEPLQRPIGRVTAVFPGNDGHVLAVTVRTQKGEYKRPAYKARKLPTDLFVDSNLVTLVRK